ncbi:MAG: lipopolysaccharide transport periplasmic protein LptA [Gammaproteobacteria bacterium RIFCSPHIGHO2_12_FULL_45_9]|nr:MAG: lipopolysaccharide transport periplasmic protein LptA [Gammaproteobacteria bacterium RIFCSPHIGHO2_12_FULL_45_9]
MALSSDSSQPCHVTADRITYERNQYKVIYEGHVTATQGTSKLTGDLIILWLDPKTGGLLRLEDHGNLAEYTTITDPHKPPLIARARVIQYDFVKKTVLLLQDGFIQQGRDTFTGPHIWYDITNQHVVSTSVPGQGQTTIVIQPSEVK